MIALWLLLAVLTLVLFAGLCWRRCFACKPCPAPAPTPTIDPTTFIDALNANLYVLPARPSGSPQTTDASSWTLFTGLATSSFGVGTLAQTAALTSLISLAPQVGTAFGVLGDFTLAVQPDGTVYVYGNVPGYQLAQVEVWRQNPVVEFTLESTPPLNIFSFDPVPLLSDTFTSNTAYWSGSIDIAAGNTYMYISDGD
jgi:hypothetical protein